MLAHRFIAICWVLVGTVGVWQCGRQLTLDTNKPSERFRLDLWWWVGIECSIDTILAALIFLAAFCVGVAAWWDRPWTKRPLLCFSILLLPFGLGHLRLMTKMTENLDIGLSIRACLLIVVCVGTMAVLLLRSSNAKPG